MDSSSDLSDPPSSPLSSLSQTPSISPRSSASSKSPSPSSQSQLPQRYPSPPSTMPSGNASPMKSDSIDTDTICAHPDGAPPAKRRRVERKPRTTEYLHLRPASEHSEEDEALLERLTLALRKKKKIVVVAGAGISVSAGIPDFRSATGLFKTIPKQHGVKGSGKQLFDASVYKHSSSTSSFHDMLRELAYQSKIAKPTPFHHLIASIAQSGRLLRLYSQNVDGIDTSMPPLATQVPLEVKGPWPRTIQLHGCIEKMVCSKCTDIQPLDASLFEGPEAPLCKGCEETDNVRTSHAGKRSHGIGRLRPRMVLYNELNPEQEAIAKVVKADMRARPDAVIVVGTSMKIPGVRSLVQDLCRITRERKDGITAWINLDSEPSGVELKDCWDLVVRGKCDDVASLVNLPHWDESPEINDHVEVDNKKYKENLLGQELQVRIPSPTISDVAIKGLRDTTPVEAKSKSVEKVQGIPTPTASPKMRTALPTKPVPKTKQSQLAFAGRVEKLSPATSAQEGKKTGRKPRQQKKTEPKAAASSTVKNAFKATKVTSKVPAKRLLDPDSSEGDFTLRPSVPRAKVDSHESKLEQKAVDTQILHETSQHAMIPATPEQSNRPCSSHSQTITPPSKPRGMAGLID